ncbi:MAG: hypothetical protein A2046_11820 [Bacteroidetes bacterium GWA2_30_7]|nr:MAG: hypothetical protein A2046_11820 [Bacteroidetes bacterium GWA2_30_7]
MQKFQKFHLILILLGSLVLLFIIAPLLGLFLNTSSAEIFETVKEKEVRDSIWLTIWTSMLATVGFAIIGIPLAYFLAKRKFLFRRLILGIIDIPVVIPHSAAGIAILGFISRDSALGQMAESVGINLVGHPIAISLAMAFVSVPFLINAAIDGFSSVPDRLEKVAMSLGASSAKVFFTISLPLAWRNIVSGLIMMFARGMSEFGAVVIVAYHPMITPVMIFERFGAYGLSYARPVAAIFVFICLLIFIGLRMLTKEKNVSRN